MKITTIRKDKKGKPHLKVMSFGTLMNSVLEDNKYGDIDNLRSFVRRAESYYTFGNLYRLPYIYPSVEMRQKTDGLMIVKQFNGLLTLTVSTVRDRKEAEDVKRMAAILPCTYAALIGSSQRSVKIIVNTSRPDGSLPETEEEMEAYCEQVYPIICRLYEPILKMAKTSDGLMVMPALRQQETRLLTTGFRITVDKNPYFQEKAIALRIPKDAIMPESVQMPATEETEAQSETVIQTTRQLIDFMEKHYAFRMNTIMGYVEYRSKEKWHYGWRPVDERIQNSMAMEARLAGLNVWDKDISRYLKSDHIHIYNPLEDYLWGLYKKWDGHDYIADVARRVPTNNPHWEKWFRTWFLAMVAQWLGKNFRYGNAMVPLLISKQGYNKSTFCKSLIPYDLQWGYNDNLVLSERKSVLQAMSQFLLINLDEFNQISPAIQDGFLKNLVQQASVKVKRPYGKHVEEFQRLASFIATSNMTDILSDPTGSRRFMGIEVTGPINVSEPIPYDQLYAQAMELLDRKEPYWLNDDQTRQLMASNRQFQMRSPEELFFEECFGIPEREEDGQYMTTAHIFSIIKKRAGSAIRTGNLRTFGRFLTNIEQLKRKRTRFGSEYLVFLKE